MPEFVGLPTGAAVGVVGSEAAKFTRVTEAAARSLVRHLIHGARAVVSGACHLGGVDLWAAEEGWLDGIEVIEFPPDDLSWSTGFRLRNIRIAGASDAVVCITVSELPEGYSGMEFPWCYHCRSRSHVKSGGCWTVKYARGLGKPGQVWVVRPDGTARRES